MSEILFFPDRKQKIVGSLFLFVMMSLVTIGLIPLFIPEETVRPFSLVLVFMLTLIYVTCAVWNIYGLIPRLLLRGKYVSYLCALTGMAVFCVTAIIMFEWATLSFYGLEPRDYGFFSSKNDSGFNFSLTVSNIIVCSFTLIAASLIVFLRHMQQSGKRVYELEKNGVVAELENARCKIDPEALTDVLNRAESVAVSNPDEASKMLTLLGKSLRRQLYDNRANPVLSAVTEKTNNAFADNHRFLNFLVDRRFHRARLLLLTIVVCIIGSAFSSSWLGFVVVCTVFMAIIFFNIYVLLPRLFFKNNIIRYVAAILLIAILFMALFTILTPSDTFQISGISLLSIIRNVVSLGLMFAGTGAVFIFRRQAQNERRIYQLETAAMRAELEQLQNQINPHFLFNMLNNIITLIRETPDEAVVYLRKLSDMLKYQFGGSKKKDVLLSDDIKFLNDFLNLEKIRRDSFEFSVTADNDAENRRVPPLLFIPFVENAVKHGADTVNHSYIRLNFKVADDMLHFTLINSKPPTPARNNECGGLGLVNIRRRLELLFGDDYSLDIQDAETTYTVNLSIKI
jgi:sensor histidine kinase YesM